MTIYEGICYAFFAALATLAAGLPDVYKRQVHDIEGVGIGLYLAREIITMQGG